MESINVIKIIDQLDYLEQTTNGISTGLISLSECSSVLDKNHIDLLNVYGTNLKNVAMKLVEIRESLDLIIMNHSQG